MTSSVSFTPLGDRLRKRRLEVGLSVRGLAERSGVSPSTISRIENGLFTPSLMTARRLAEALGVSLPDFPESSEQRPTPPHGDDAPLNRRPLEPAPASLDDATSPVAVRRQVLAPGVRKDLRRIASGKAYRFLVVLDGEVQIRGRDGSRLWLRPGLRLDCDLLRNDTFFAVSRNAAELLWIG